MDKIQADLYEEWKGGMSGWDELDHQLKLVHRADKVLKRLENG